METFLLRPGKISGKVTKTMGLSQREIKEKRTQNTQFTITLTRTNSANL